MKIKVSSLTAGLFAAGALGAGILIGYSVKSEPREEKKFEKKFYSKKFYSMDDHKIKSIVHGREAIYISKRDINADSREDALIMLKGGNAILLLSEGQQYFAVQGSESDFDRAISARIDGKRLLIESDGTNGKSYASVVDLEQLGMETSLRLEYAKPPWLLGVSSVVRGYNAAVREREEAKIEKERVTSPFLPSRGCGDPYRECTSVENPDYRPPPRMEEKRPLEPFEQRLGRDLSAKAGELGKKAEELGKAIGNILGQKEKKQ